ncbi:MAG: hypothetical protein AAFW73_23970, partial [Bacteroidota bacterium]
MVNLLTGDFVYNLPLLEVPGPEGGFPINLFYHAGIKTHQEASNYGLGWGFNAGSISRSVNGYPDDYQGEEFNTNLYRVWEDRYDSGSTNTTYSFGFQVPKTPFSVTSSETYNSNLGKFGSNSLNLYGVNLLDFQSDPGGQSVKFGSGLQPSYGNGVKDYQNDYLGWEQSGRQGLAPGYSSVSFSLKDGLKTTRTGRAGDWNIETTTKGLNLGVINFSTTTVRQWLDLSRPLRPYGSLTSAFAKFDGVIPSSSYTYSMDITEDRNNSREQDNTGGVHLALDNYQVNSASVGGSIQPTVFQNGSLMGRQFAAGPNDPTDNYYKLRNFDGYFSLYDDQPGRTRFRYAGDFSSERQMPGGTIYKTSAATPTFASSSSSFVGTPADDVPNGFKNRYLKASKFVEHFGELDLGISGGSVQNSDRRNRVKNFVQNRPSAYVATQFDNSKVHAFKITGEDGSEHHYGLPAFITYEEAVAFETERWVSGNAVEQVNTTNAYSRTRKNSPYPYTWLQTAITGNDYIDRNDDGLTDPDDYGSYVRFAYGNHTQNKPYPYRAPFSGYEFEPSFSGKTATFGKKQLFYLNGIQTRSHTAIFFHSVRSDGRGPSVDALGDGVSSADHTMSQLRTDKIVLLKNEDVQTLLSSGDLNDRGVDWGNRPTAGQTPYLTSEFNSAIQAKALQIIDFTYTYDLSQQTINSTAIGQGKLTLTKVSKKGKGGALVLPSYNFDYDKNNNAANPDFGLQDYDRWGYYKGNVQLTGPSGNQYPVNRTVSCGNNDAAAWSLREIEMPVGAKIKIDYEPDTYYRVGSSNFNFPTPDNYLMFRKTRGFFSSLNTSQFITIPNNAQGDSFRAALQAAKDANEQVSVIVREASTGEETCFGFSTITSISLVSGFYRVTFDIQFGLKPSESILAIALVSNKFPHQTICNNGNGADEVNGGGIRVASLELRSGSGQVEQRQEFTYQQSESGTDFSSGVVPYEPSALDLHMGYLMFSDDKTTSTFNGSIGAQVNYAEVNITKKNGAGEFIDRERYTFETYDQPTHFTVNTAQSSFDGFDDIYTTEITDRTSQIGRPLSIERYNRLGQCYRKKIFEYYSNPPLNQGVTRDYLHSIRSRKRVFGTPFCLLDGYVNFNGALQLREEDWKVLITKRNTYPSVLQKVRTIDNGMESALAYTSFDFYTGKPTRTEATDPNNEKIITTIDPAYQRYARMGSKVDDLDNQNMLIQEAGNYVYRNSVSSNNIVDAEVQTWTNNAYRYRTLSGSNYVDQVPPSSEDMWRPYRNYTWRSDARPDGTMAGYVNFNFNGTSDSRWINTKEVTRYDRYSKSLEERFLDDNYSSIKMGYNETLPITAANPAKYVEFAYSGAEDHLQTVNYFGGEVRAPNISAVDDSRAHTGQYSVRLNSGTRYGLNYQIPVRLYNQSLDPGEIERKKYEARVWIHQDNVSTTFNYLYCNYENSSGTSLKWDAARIGDASTIKAGEWYLLRLPIEIDNSSTLLNCTRIEIGTWVPSSS